MVTSRHAFGDKSLSQEGRENNPLLGLRGIAAVIVVAYHCNFVWPIPHNQWLLGGFISRGYLFVDVFFIVSGLSISLKYRDVMSDHLTNISISRFLFMRFTRIAPAYLLWALISVVVWAFLNYKSGFSFDEFVLSVAAYAALIQVFVNPSYDFNVPLWSVAVESLVYCVFPLLIWMRRAFGRLLYIFSVLSVSLLCYFLVFFAVHKLDIIDGVYAYLRCLGGFGLGVVIHAVTPPVAVRAHDKISLLILTGSLLSIYSIASGREALAVVSVFALIAGLQLRGAGLDIISLFLNCRPTQFLGEISYSLYLCHAVILSLLSVLYYKYKYLLVSIFVIDNLWYVGTAATVSIAVACATVSRIYVERSALIWLRSFVR